MKPLNNYIFLEEVKADESEDKWLYNPEAVAIKKYRVTGLSGSAIGRVEVGDVVAIRTADVEELFDDTSFSTPSKLIGVENA